MTEKKSDTAVLTHIQELVDEEHALMQRGALDADAEARLAGIKVQLDQYWDLLRQRRALRETGHDADEAHIRPPGTVEKYIG
jgi:hypothetical protein